jgi:Rap1a immunity proteins
LSWINGERECRSSARFQPGTDLLLRSHTVQLNKGNIMRNALIAASLALAASAQAAPPEHYRLQTAAELSRLCATPSSESDHVTAVAFCHGVLAGSYGYFLSVTPVADRFVCPPNPAPTRSQVANGFVAWLKARPQYNSDGAIDALFRYAAEAFPCKR